MLDGLHARLNARRALVKLFGAAFCKIYGLSAWTTYSHSIRVPSTVEALEMGAGRETAVWGSQSRIICAEPMSLDFQMLFGDCEIGD